MTEEELKNSKILEKEYSEVLTLSHEINKDLLRPRIEMINQRREIFKFIVYLIAAIIGSSYFLNVSTSQNYYLIGVVLLVSIIIFIMLYLRETTDIGSIQLRDLQDMYNSILDDKIDLVLRHINEKKYSNTDIQAYFQELGNLPGAKKLADDIKTSREARENRKKELLDYSGELVMFLFLSGLFFIIGSIFPSHFNWLVILFGEIVILVIACTNFAILISKSFSFVIDRIRKTIK